MPSPSGIVDGPWSQGPTPRPSVINVFVSIALARRVEHSHRSAIFIEFSQLTLSRAVAYKRKKR